MTRHKLTRGDIAACAVIIGMGLAVPGVIITTVIAIVVGVQKGVFG